MKTFLFIGISTFILLSCSQEPYKCNCDTSAVTKNDSIIGSMLKDTSSYNRFLRNYRIPHLAIYKNECYRLKLSHSFSKYTQIYTLIHTGSGAVLDVKEYLNPKSKPVKLKLHIAYTIELSNKQWHEIKKAIETNCYWSQPINERNRQVLDGGSWLLEGYDPEKRNCAKALYHIDDCYYEDNSDFGNLCRLIKKYAHEEKLNIYSNHR